jgi:hypothetical protein
MTVYALLPVLGHFPLTPRKDYPPCVKEEACIAPTFFDHKSDCQNWEYGVIMPETGVNGHAVADCGTVLPAETLMPFRPLFRIVDIGLFW